MAVLFGRGSFLAIRTGSLHRAPMRVVICEHQDEAADLVADEIIKALKEKPDLVLGLATGSTPIGVYERLIRAHREGGADFSKVQTFNLDEYLGLSGDHPQSYRYFMRKNLFDGLELVESQSHFPPSQGLGLLAKCQEFENKIENSGGIDIQLLGIGSNGHIGFNEPTSSFASRTRLKTLCDKTLRDNARFYGPGEEQPSVAATMGIGTILGARRVLLQAFGSGKAQAIQASVEGAMSSFWPASALQMHARAEFYLDVASAERLSLRDYYQTVRKSEQELAERDIL